MQKNVAQLASCTVMCGAVVYKLRGSITHIGQWCACVQHWVM